MMTVAEITKEVQALPLESRGELIETIIQSFDDSFSSAHDKEWIAEVKRRREEIRSGRVQAINGVDAAQHVRSLLRR